MLKQSILAHQSLTITASRFALLILVLSLSTNALLAGKVFFSDQSIKTQLIPPEITKPFWIDGKHLDLEYVDQIAQYFMFRYANVTPSSIDGNVEEILKHVSPAVHGDLAVQLRGAAAQIKKDSISRYFWPKEVRIAPDNRTVAFIGTMETWIGDKKVPENQLKAIRVGLKQGDGSLVTLSELREVDPNSPFENKEPAQ